MTSSWHQALVGICLALMAGCKRVPCASDTGSQMTCENTGSCDGPCRDVPALYDQPIIQANDEPHAISTDAPSGMTVSFTVEPLQLPQSNFRCGHATAIPPRPATGPQSLFVIGDWIYMATDGSAGRWNRRTSVAQLFTRPESGGPGYWAVLAAQGSRIAAVLNEPYGDRPAGVNPRWAHFAVFDDPLLPGRLLRTHRFPDGIGGAIQEFVATTRMMAWVVKTGAVTYLGVPHSNWPTGTHCAGRFHRI